MNRTTIPAGTNLTIQYPAFRWSGDYIVALDDDGRECGMSFSREAALAFASELRKVASSGPADE